MTILMAEGGNGDAARADLSCHEDVTQEHGEKATRGGLCDTAGDPYLTSQWQKNFRKKKI